MVSYPGSVATDLRGKVTFCNDFTFRGVKRFYMVENREKGQVRAWHGHKKEAKYVFVIQGKALVIVEDMYTGKRQKHYLDANKPEVLRIPPGKYNGAQSLSKDTKIMYFSTKTLEESQADDYRRDIDWDEELDLWERV